MAVIAAILISIGLVTTFYPVCDKPKDEVNINMGIVGVRAVKYKVRPLSEFKNDKVVKQGYDFSCGSAALATILNYDFGEKLEEKQVIQGLMRHGDKEKIEQRRAFSLLDMKRFIKVLGYRGVGYKAEIDDLVTLTDPGIVPIEIFGYRHFVVLKGIYDNHVFVADPSQGNISFTLEKFKKMWTEKIIFIVYPENGEKKWHPLSLTDDDLRYIDFDMTRRMISGKEPSYTQRIEDDLHEAGGGYMIYRAR